MVKRTVRLNSLLREVLSEVIRNEVKDPNLPPFVSITSVDISTDLRHAKVLFSVIGDKAVREKTLKILTNMRSFISVTASKKVRIRYFPELTFRIDDSVDKQMEIEAIIQKLHKDDDN